MRVRYFFFYGYEDLRFLSAIFQSRREFSDPKLFFKKPLREWETQLEEVTPRNVWKEIFRNKIKARSIMKEIHPNFYLYDYITKEVIGRPIRNIKSVTK